MKKTMIALSLMAVTALTGCQVEQQFAKETPLYVSTYEVQQAVQSQFRTFKGQVVPAEQTPLAFRLSGEVMHVLVQAGDQVEKGDLLAKLDDRKARQEFDDADAKYALALKQLKRGQELRKRAMISSAELDELVANQQLAAAQYRAAKNQLDYTRLRAPFDGKVSDVTKERFERVNAGEPVLSLYQDDQVYVKINLSDNVLAMINPDGNDIRYRPYAHFSGYEGSHQLTYLEHTSEPNAYSQTYEMWLTMPQAETPILPGTSVSVDVDMVQAGITSVDGYLVPMTSLQAGDNTQEFTVWKLNGDKVTASPISVTQVNGSGAIASSGVTQGDILVNSNLRKLRNGMTVVTSNDAAEK